MENKNDPKKIPIDWKDENVQKNYFDRQSLGFGNPALIKAIGCRVSEDVYGALVKQAEEWEISPSEALRRIVNNYLEPGTLMNHAKEQIWSGGVAASLLDINENDAEFYKTPFNKYKVTSIILWKLDMYWKSLYISRKNTQRVLDEINSQMDSIAEFIRDMTIKLDLKPLEMKGGDDTIKKRNQSRKAKS